MQITPATPSDEAGVKALLQSCELPFEDLTPAHLTHFLVIKDGDQIVGSVGLEGCRAFALLRSLAVAESKRGQGLGYQLIEQIETYARSQQISALYLLTTTADQYFARQGYQVVPRESAPAPLQETTEFKSICPDSAVCMYRNL
jgi:amino-acid N-acetyltransferase